ncbi:MAG: radical SAM protein [Candidatus Aegiribacteria sp.]|nr:radical SAM protein [Candidatus Aegiribacteria sp.]MBD3295596.1 radical SAM protein [Candidatus Fermentibacteria bacterium]
MTLPSLIHLYVNPVADCNLACSHCWIAPSRSGEPFATRNRKTSEFSPVQFSMLLDQAADLGLKHVKFTGGEPLLREDFPEIYCVASKHPAVLEVDVETNGTLQPEGLWKAFAKNRPNSVAVSLDSVKPDLHDDFRNTPGAWNRTVAFIHKLVELEINTQVIMSTADFLVEPVLEMAAFCGNAGVSSLKVNPVQPIGRGTGMNIPALGMEKILEFSRQVFSKCGGSVRLDLPPALMPLGRLPAVGHCPIHNLMGILPDGGVSFCGIGFSCPELVMGNFLRKSLRIIWNDSPILKKIRRELPEELQGICSNCIHKNSCLAKCLMQNYYSCGGFTASYWMCTAADEEGLFPKTRKILTND